MTNPLHRERYLTNSVSTASPGRLVVMLYDRLILDLGQAEEALHAGDRETGSDRLMHAQSIVTELHIALDQSTWSGASGLAALYQFILGELVQANINKDAERAAVCRTLIEPLAGAWREALTAVSAPKAGARGTTELAASRVA